MMMYGYPCLPFSPPSPAQCTSCCSEADEAQMQVANRDLSVVSKRCSVLQCQHKCEHKVPFAAQATGANNGVTYRCVRRL